MKELETVGDEGRKEGPCAGDSENVVGDLGNKFGNEEGE